MIPFLLLLITIEAYSQNQTLSGKILDEKGNPISGASISQKNTAQGTLTNSTGDFTLNVPSENAVLVVSFVGYLSKEVQISKNQRSIRITLLEMVTKLEDVIVIGYGTQKTTKVSGAISTLRSADIQKVNAVRVEDAIQGRVPGVTVVQSYTPGAKPTFIIRGIPSYAGNDPLIVVDGVFQTLDDFNAINPSDIESVNVLKDAATTAIFGVKGGNGVVVVTTKQGKKNQKSIFSLNTNYGIQEVSKTIGVLNATEYGAILNEGSTTSGGSIIFPDLSILGVGTNWQDQIFKKSPIQSYNLSSSGGSDKTSYFFSLGYTNQGGVVGGIDKSNFSRGNFTANLNFSLTPKLKFLWNTSGVVLSSKGVQENSFNSIIGSALNFDPTVPVFNIVPNTIGKYGFSNLILSEVYNPLTKLDNTFNTNTGTKVYGKFELQYEIKKDLILNSRFGYTKYDDNAKSFAPLIFYGPNNVDNSLNSDGTTVLDKHNSVSQAKTSSFNYSWESFLNYNFKINTDHHFESVFGFSIARTSGNSAGASKQDVPFNSFIYADNTLATGVNTDKNNLANTGYYYQYFRNNSSFFARLNYDYLDKYLASLTVRRDGSNAFGANNKFGNFPSGSLSWVISNEDFFKPTFINRLKVRASYGSVGNDGNTFPQYNSVVTGGVINSDAPNATYNSNGYNFDGIFKNGSSLSTSVNPNLKWETNSQFDVGVDINFYKNKFFITADYYIKNTKDLLFSPSGSLYIGAIPLPLANIGSTRTKGFEFLFSYTDQVTKKLKINSSLNFSSFNNLVTATNADGTARIFSGSFYNGQNQNVTVFEKGQSAYYFYGYKTQGLFQTSADIDNAPKQIGAQPGDIRFVDLNQDGIIDSKDQTKIGNPFPKFTLGWNLGMEYMNFDFNTFIYSSVGNDVYRAYERNGNYTNKFRAVLARWTGVNTTNDAKNPRYTFTDPNSNIRASDRYIEDGSFIRLKTVQLGYSLPNSWVGKTFSKVRVYLQVKNALTLTKYSGFDPEIQSGGLGNTGVDFGSYPPARIYSFGLDVKF